MRSRGIQETLLYLGADSGGILVLPQVAARLTLEHIDPKPIYPELIHLPAGALERWKIVSISLEGKGGGVLGLYDPGLEAGGLRFMRQKGLGRPIVWAPLKRMTIAILNKTDKPARFVATIVCAERAPRVAS